MPKVQHRGPTATAGVYRSHSATKLGPANLQFTQHKDLSKKNGLQTHYRTASAQRFIDPVKQAQRPAVKPKKNFTIASPSEHSKDEDDDDDDDDDEDAWTSESGAVTPQRAEESEESSEEELEEEEAVRRIIAGPVAPAVLPRVDTARLSDFHPATTTTMEPQQRPTRRTSTRPPSSHSVRSDYAALRPHPLIRGLSSGTPTSLLNHSKPSPLEPLTTSTTTSTTTTEPQLLSSSPTSAIPYYSPTLPNTRRQSVSSTRSVATLPNSFSDNNNSRRRTLSSISHSSSSAALSSLVHLPTVTRPPSPQAIAFFPPVNPHANIDAIHPLLPAPYLHSHLAVLTRRTPIKEAFDRVVSAKHGQMMA